MKLVDSI